jgi:hypothetical protein
MSFLVSRELKRTLSCADPCVTTESQGRFTFECVPPVDVFLSEMQTHPQIGFRVLQLVEVAPGKTTSMEVATRGVTVVGRLELEPGLINRVDPLRAGV